jgi:hypothetical protein
MICYIIFTKVLLKSVLFIRLLVVCLKVIKLFLCTSIKPKTIGGLKPKSCVKKILKAACGKPDTKICAGLDCTGKAVLFPVTIALVL